MSSDSRARRYLEPADECRRDGAIELRQHLVARGDDGVQTLGGRPSNLPAHVVVVAVLVVAAWTDRQTGCYHPQCRVENYTLMVSYRNTVQTSACFLSEVGGAQLEMVMSYFSMLSSGLSD